MKTIAALAMLLASASPAVAQDGGKIKWRGKDEDPKIVLAQNKERASVLFFTSTGCKYCVQLSQGAFSDAEVLAAAADLLCIFVDCDWGKKNQELTKQYSVTGYPTVVLVEPGGREAKRYSSGDGPVLAEAFRYLQKLYPGGTVPALPPPKPAFQEYSPQLLESARTVSKKPILLFFYDESPASGSVTRALAEPQVRALRDRVLLAQTPYAKDADWCRQWGVDRAPTLLLLDPTKEKTESQPLGRIAGSRSPRELARELEALLGGTPAPAAAPGASSAPASSPREEPLSDDEVDRKFIQARMGLAVDAWKRGKKAKAIEILEDVAQSFPKHVLTKDAKELLENYRKQP